MLYYICLILILLHYYSYYNNNNLNTYNTGSFLSTKFVTAVMIIEARVAFGKYFNTGATNNNTRKIIVTLTYYNNIIVK